MQKLEEMQERIAITPRSFNWSEDDQSFVVTLPEFTNVMQPGTHGHTYIELVGQASSA